MRRECFRPWAASAALILLLLAVPSTVAHAGDQPQPGKSAEAPMVRVLVAYHSRRGNTEKMAQGAAEGARQVPRVAVTLKKVEDVTKEDLQAAHGIVLGAPTYYANIPGTMKTVIDDWAWKMKVDFTDKVGGALATGGDQTGGKEHVVVSLLLFMINNRMVVAGPLQQGKDPGDIWAEIGASAATGPTDPGVGDHDLDAARRLGRRIATLARKLHGR